VTTRRDTKDDEKVAAVANAANDMVDMAANPEFVILQLYTIFNCRDRGYQIQGCRSAQLAQRQQQVPSHSHLVPGITLPNYTHDLMGYMKNSFNPLGSHSGAA
jgi:hypothetical protein